MESKEEILDKVYPLKKGGALPVDQRLYNQSEAFKAMDEYAKHESQSFAEWIAENAMPFLVKNLWTLNKDKKNKGYTTEQLFTIYKNTP